DRYVVMGPGDETTLQFDAAASPALPPGWRRDFLLYTDGWIKDADLNTALGNTVGPLPFHAILSRATPIPFRFHRGLKQGRLVGVITQRPPILLHVPLQQVLVLHRRVAVHKARQPGARRIVDHIDQQDLLPTSFQPVVVARVPLHQLSHTATPRTPFMDLLNVLLPPAPQLGLHHPSPHRLPTRLDGVFLG